MKRKTILFSIIFQLLCYLKLYSQEIELKMDSLSHGIGTHSWCYIGDGEFIGVRSCYETRIECTFYSASYNKETHTLFVKGRIYNDTKGWEGPIKFAQILIGNFSHDTSNVTAPPISISAKDTSVIINPDGFHVTGKHFIIRSKIDADIKGRFKGKFHVENITDELCIVTTDKNGFSETATSKFYSIGKLLKLK